MNYYYADNENQTAGPVSLEAIRALVKKGLLRRDPMVVPEGGTEWKPLSTYAETTPAETTPPAAAPKPIRVHPQAAAAPAATPAATPAAQPAKPATAPAPAKPATT